MSPEEASPAQLGVEVMALGSCHPPAAGVPPDKHGVLHCSTIVLLLLPPGKHGLLVTYLLVIHYTTYT